MVAETSAQEAPERDFHKGKGRLKEMAQQQGIEVIDLVKNAIRSEGSANKAAAKLHVSRATIEHHLKRAGLGFRAVVMIEFFPLKRDS